jgi:hypothetical protein
MKTKKQELIDEPKEFKNEDHLLECFFSEKLNKFCLMFNAKLFTFKTWNGFVNKRNDFIERFNLS